MDRVANVYDIDTLARLEAIDTAHNPHVRYHALYEAY